MATCYHCGQNECSCPPIPISVWEDVRAGLEAEVESLRIQLAEAQREHNAQVLDAADFLTDRDTALAQLAEVTRERDEARAALTALKQDRIVSVIFGHHKGAPRPFALYRREDVSGVSGTGVVAVGCEFPDGLVVLRWTSAWPTSVVFHERGIDSVKAIHGDGRTEIVWLSDELESLAEMEQQRDAALKVVEAVKAWRERVAGSILGAHERPLAEAVDAHPQQAGTDCCARSLIEDSQQ